MVRVWVFGLLCMFVLVGCQEAAVDVPVNEVSDVAEDNVVANDNNAELVENEEPDVTGDNDSVTNAEELWARVVLAMGEASGFNLSGVVRENMVMAGVVSEEVQTITGDATVSPFAQHHFIHTESSLDPPSDFEMYINDEMMYAYVDDIGWLAMDLDELFGEAGLMLTEGSLNSFIKYHELFEFADEGEHYTLTFTGEDDVYKRVIIGVDNPSYDYLASAIQEIAGTFVFTIDKESFYIVKTEANIEQKVVLNGVELRSEEEMTYAYSNHNEVGPFTVPDEVAQSAIEFSLPKLP